MKICIIGAGNVGGNIARKLQAKHEIYIQGSSSDSKKAKSLSNEFPNIHHVDLDSALGMSEVVIIAIHAPQVVDFISSEKLNGQIVIDAVNQLFEPISEDGYDSVTDYIKKNSAATHVYKAFNTSFAETILSAKSKSSDMMFAGDEDEESLSKVRSIISDVGFAPKYVGDVNKAKFLELFTKAYAGIFIDRANGRNTTYRIIND